MKALGLLTVDFISLLPLKTRKTKRYRSLGGTYQSYLETDSVFYEAFYDETVKAFINEELLPTKNSKFTTADKAILARGAAIDTRRETIVDLLTAEDNAVVFKNRTIWLSTDITIDRTPEIRNFLIATLKVKEVDFDELLTTVNGAFLESKSIEWLIRFYKIGNRNILTVKDKHLNKEIIRTESGKMVVPFINKKPNVYIASKMTNDPEKIVNKMLSQNEEVRKFFLDIEIEEMGIVESIRTQWLPSLTSCKDECDHGDEIELLFLEYDNQKIDTQAELRYLLRNSDCIMYKNVADNICFGKPTDFFMAHGIPKTLYDGCNNVRFLNDTLNAKAENNKEFYDFLKKIGVKTSIEMIEQNDKLTHDEREKLLKNKVYSSWSLVEKSCQIFEIQYILNNITIERSKALWKALEDIPEDKFNGTITWSYYSKQYKEVFKSYFIRTLQNEKWLYCGKNDEPVSPCDVFLDEAEKEYKRNAMLTKYINFKPDAEKQLSPDLQEILTLAKQIPIDELRRLAEACAALSETQEVIDILPEEIPVNIEAVEFNNSKRDLTSDELVNDKNEDSEGNITKTLDDLYSNADIPDRIKEKIAIKNVTDEAEVDGDLGERFVISSLKEEYRKTGYMITNEDINSFSATKESKTIDVVRHNTKERNQRGYDITIAERGIVSAYIEVKAKKDDNPKFFKVSGLQWEFAKKLYEEGNGKKHWIYVVTNVRDKTKTKITKTPNPYKAWLDGNLYADPVQIKY